MREFFSDKFVIFQIFHGIGAYILENRRVYVRKIEEKFMVLIKKDVKNIEIAAKIALRNGGESRWRIILCRDSK